jgi:hypothetical protein
MKRFRLSTLMLLIVIAALCTALVVQQYRASRRTVELEARLAMAQLAIAEVAVIERTKARKASKTNDRNDGQTKNP